MMWAITCRVIASVVTFFVGWAVFVIASPTEELRLPPSTRQLKAITLSQERCFNAERKCATFEATFRTNGTCSFTVHADVNHVRTYMGEFNAEDLTSLIERINKQGSFELPLADPKSPVTEDTSIEVTASDGTSFVVTYNRALPLDFTDCKLY